jgi:magnesium-transporting ATPase (P-type)
MVIISGSQLYTMLFKMKVFWYVVSGARKVQVFIAFLGSFNNSAMQLLKLKINVCPILVFCHGLLQWWGFIDTSQ